MDNTPTFLAEAIARRTAAGLTTVTTGINDRPEPFTAHHATIAERDAYMARCAARGETCTVLGQ